MLTICWAACSSRPSNPDAVTTSLQKIRGNGLQPYKVCLTSMTADKHWKDLYAQIDDSQGHVSRLDVAVDHQILLLLPQACH